MKSLLLAAALLLPASTAIAQPAMPNPKLLASSLEVQALIAKAKNALKDGQAFSSETILSLKPYRVALEYRTPKAPPTVHETEAELMYVIEGSGTVTTGGTLVDSKRTNASNLEGTAIAGGTVNHLSKGDFIFVPENTPHQGLAGPGGFFVLMTLHVPRPIPEK